MLLKTTRGFFSKQSLACAVVVLAAFALIYCFSFSPVYVEGDDATVVAYHALGRNPLVQRPYAIYESMFDAVLSLLPAREQTIRVVAMTLTAASAPIFFFFMMLLAFDWWGDSMSVPQWAVGLAMLMAAPEFFYLALVMTPSIIAMMFLTAAHLVIRRATAATLSPRWTRFALSALLFGIGAAFRWDTVLYGGVIVVDLALRSGDRSPAGTPSRNYRVRVAILWGVMAGIVWLAACTVPAGGPKRVLSVLGRSGPVESPSLKTFAGHIQPLLTPALLLLGAVGFWYVFRRRRPLAFITLVSIVLAGKLTLYGVPKWFITAIPSLLACAAGGFLLLWRRSSLMRYALAALLVFPWVLGLRFVFADSGWGPGFELQRYDRALKTASSRPSMIFGAGTAIPTPEGPRPLFGHGEVLFGGWRRFVQTADIEQRNAIRRAIQMGVPLLQDSGQGRALAAYAALGLTTNDSWKRTVDGGLFIERRFTGPAAMETRLLRLRDRQQLFLGAGIQRLRRVAGDTVVICGYSTTLRKLYQADPDALEVMGNFTAIFHVDKVMPH